jgi:hypothetical protein
VTRRLLRALSEFRRAFIAQLVTSIKFTSAQSCSEVALPFGTVAVVLKLLFAISSYLMFSQKMFCHSWGRLYH